MLCAIDLKDQTFGLLFTVPFKGFGLEGRKV